MTGHLAPEVIAQLLRPINPRRVNQKDGYSHVEAYDIRAHLNRVFGFAQWSADTVAMEMLYERFDDDRKRVWVGYRAQVTLKIHATGATYTEWAAGDASNFPVTKHADAHDFALKTAESQALKRAAVNLGDNFGLSLYNKGSLRPLVAGVVGFTPDEEKKDEGQPASIDAHVTEVAPEDAEPQPAEEPRTTNGASAPEPPARDESADEEKARQGAAHTIRERALSMPEGENPHRYFARLQADAAAARALNVLVESSVSPTQVTLKALIDECMRNARRTA